VSVLVVIVGGVVAGLFGFNWARNKLGMSNDTGTQLTISGGV